MLPSVCGCRQSHRFEFQVSGLVFEPHEQVAEILDSSLIVKTVSKQVELSQQHYGGVMAP